MQYEDWLEIYGEILKDFGYDRKKDEEAAREASEIISRKNIKKEGKIELEKLIKGKEVIICGNAPSLKEEIKDVLEDFERSCVIAANGATSVLLHNAIIPDIVVTDLDGNIADIIYANRIGSYVIVHAHGDNIEKLRKVLSELNENVICTTQSKPLKNVENFGGFTDGDRCVFLAKEFGAKEIKLIGFDFEDKKVSEEKRKKLKWAKKLIRDALL